MRLVVGACLGLAFLVPGIASAQADVILRAPLIIAGQPFGPTAESVRLYDHQATRVASGVCTYPVGIEIANVGGAPTTSPVAIRLEVFGVIAATQDHAGRRSIQPTHDAHAVP